MIRFTPILIFIFCLLASCRNEILIEEKIAFPDNHWIYGDKKSVIIEAVDTIQVYQLDIEVQHAVDYPFQNLYIRTLTVFPSGKEVTSVSSLELATSEGTWAGNCSGKKCKLMLPLQKKFTFPEIGKYSWTIEPYMRADTVWGIYSLELICKKAKSKGEG